MSTDEIKRLVDRQKIYDCLMRYGIGADRCDPELHRDAFWPEAIADFGQFRGNAHEFVKFSQSILVTLVKTYHLTGNVLIEFASDSRARVESKVIAYHWVMRDRDEMEIIIGGRYLDWFECRGEEWRIAERVMLIDWDRSEPSKHEFDAGLVSPDSHAGSRYPLDLRYQTQFQLA